MIIEPMVIDGHISAPINPVGVTMIIARDYGWLSSRPTQPRWDAHDLGYFHAPINPVGVPMIIGFAEMRKQIAIFI
jgi:hypothetical protein